MKGYDGLFKMIISSQKFFDTGSSDQTYPSISGKFTGTITPSQTINVSRFYNVLAQALVGIPNTSTLSETG